MTYNHPSEGGDRRRDRHRGPEPIDAFAADHTLYVVFRR